MNCLSEGVAGVRGSPRDSKAVGERICPVFTEAYSVYVEFPTLPTTKVSSVEHLWILVSTNLFHLERFFCFFSMAVSEH